MKISVRQFVWTGHETVRMEGEAVALTGRRRSRWTYDLVSDDRPFAECSSDLDGRPFTSCELVE
jgi:hypothetical protein